MTKKPLDKLIKLQDDIAVIIEELKESEAAKPKQKKEKKETDLVYITLANDFYALIRNFTSKVNEPDFLKWAEVFRRMGEIDGRTEESIRKVMSFATSDPFWQVNILSPAKLREKFDMLSIKSEKKEDGIKYGAQKIGFRYGRNEETNSGNKKPTGWLGSSKRTTETDL